MPQVDLETLVSACAGGSSDHKIACETLADRKDDDFPGKDDAHVTQPRPTNSDVAPDFPPESFWLSKDAELDWMDRNAFFERKESTKGMPTNSQQHPPGSNSNSQRFSLNLTSTSKASIIGLPKTQKATYVEGRRRSAAKKPSNIRLFPKKSGGLVGKPATSVIEPSSPKVSCMGRVRSKRRSRSLRSNEPGKLKDNPFERSRSRRDKKKPGICSGFLSIFKGKDSKSVKKPVERKSTVEEVPAKKSMSASRRAREFPSVAEPKHEAPGLGGMKRFASGRRSTEEFDGVVIGGSLELDRHQGPTGSS